MWNANSGQVVNMSNAFWLTELDHSSIHFLYSLNNPRNWKLITVKLKSSLTSSLSQVQCDLVRTVTSLLNSITIKILIHLYMHFGRREFRSNSPAAFWDYYYSSPTLTHSYWYQNKKSPPPRTQDRWNSFHAFFHSLTTVLGTNT